MSDATLKISASMTRISRKSTTSVSGSRTDAISGGTKAFTTTTKSATSSAPQKLGIETPGTIAAAISNAGAMTSTVPMKRTMRKRGTSGCQSGSCPYASAITGTFALARSRRIVRSG